VCEALNLIRVCHQRHWWQAPTLLEKDLLKLLQRGGMGLSKTTESWKIIVWKELEEKLGSLVV